MHNRLPWYNNAFMYRIRFLIDQCKFQKYFTAKHFQKS